MKEELDNFFDIPEEISPPISTPQVSSNKYKYNNKKRPLKTKKKQPQDIVGMPLKYSEGNINVEMRGLKRKQKLFIKDYMEAFSLYITSTKSKRVRIKNIIESCENVGINYLMLYYWRQRDEHFERIFKVIEQARSSCINILLESQLMQNSFSGKEASLIFAIKNRMPENYRDDAILQQLFIKTNQINFNYIKTTVDDKSNVQLIELGRRLTEELAHMTEGVEGGDESAGVDIPSPGVPDQKETIQDEVVQDAVVLD